MKTVQINSLRFRQHFVGWEGGLGAAHPYVVRIAHIEKSDALNQQPHLCVLVQMLLIKHGFLGGKVRGGFGVEGDAVVLKEPGGE
jgi:hypothetical protein